MHGKHLIKFAAFALALTGGAFLSSNTASAAGATSTPGQHITLPGGLQGMNVGGMTIYTNNPGITGSVTWNTGSSSGSGVISGGASSTNSVTIGR